MFDNNNVACDHVMLPVYIYIYIYTCILYDEVVVVVDGVVLVVCCC